MMKSTKIERSLFVLACSAALLAGCASKMADGPSAIVDLKPTQGQTATGQLTMRQDRDRVIVTAHVTGLKPNQAHGFHVHEKGDCSSPDGSSAGAHLNPDGSAHGMPEMGIPHHAGDMPALMSDSAGRADATFDVVGTLSGAPGAFVGKAVIVHAAPDDYKTQPTGNSGARIACGIVTMK